jgi:Na+/proline symporter
MSGMASFLDITGTMIIVSFLYMLGPKGLFIEFRGGAVLILAIMMLWTGKWHRRSQCITNAEWMIFRFGEGFGGQFARIVSAIAAMVGTIGMLAFMVKGVGLFLSMFIPFSPLTCSLMMIGVATIYTMMSGFYGVVYTDIFQAGIILIAVVAISIMAIIKVPDAQSLSALAFEVTG